MTRPLERAQEPEIPSPLGEMLGVCSALYRVYGVNGRGHTRNERIILFAYTKQLRQDADVKVHGIASSRRLVLFMSIPRQPVAPEASGNNFCRRCLPRMEHLSTNRFTDTLEIQAFACPANWEGIGSAFLPSFVTYKRKSQ